MFLSGVELTPREMSETKKVAGLGAASLAGQR